MSRSRMRKLALLGGAVGWGLSYPACGAPLTIEDVLNTVSIDGVDISPDGTEVAVSVQRPPSDTEVAGRAPYEIDPSRNDVWIVARNGESRRNLTMGVAKGAGYWCVQWSPDGRRLAMLSTEPEHGEARGGDAVRLYVWKRTDARPKRLSQRAVMTQTRYGSPINALDLRVGNADPKVCRRHEENSPYLWLDDRHMLAVLMPPGQQSALFVQYGRSAQNAAKVAEALRGGRETTVDVADTERASLADRVRDYSAELVVIDVETKRSKLLATVPAFPFRGMLSLSMSPDRRHLAVLAPVGAISPSLLGPAPLQINDAQVQKRLGFISLSEGGSVSWIDPPRLGKYPLDLLDWSPDGARLMFRGRMAASDRHARTFAVSPSTKMVEALAPEVVSDVLDVGQVPRNPSAEWQDGDSVLIHGRVEKAADPAPAWWQVVAGKVLQRVEKSAVADVPAALPSNAEILAEDRQGVIWQRRTDRGLSLWGSLRTGQMAHELMALNSHLAKVDWGAVKAIDYTGQQGKALKGLVIFPPQYDAKKPYPLLVWVYPGTSIRDEFGYWADKYSAGIYNLQLYAANGFVVLVPSMPLPTENEGDRLYRAMPDGVIPAIDRLAELKVIDPQRIGVFGQSWGGYAVYSLVSQVNRFKAAVAIAGITDYISMHGSFDPTAAGWPGAAQDKSDNAIIAETNHRLHDGPFDRPRTYSANSPITYVGRVETPLLMAHGSLDTRAGIEQAETFFTELDRQGKRARLLRYQGEDHAIALSPANVRNLFFEMIEWFRRYL